MAIHEVWSMVFVLYGNSGHIAYVGRKQVFFDNNFFGLLSIETNQT